MRLTNSWLIATPVLLAPTSTVGAVPVTTTSSARSDSGVRRKLTRMVLSPRTTMPLREKGR